MNEAIIKEINSEIARLTQARNILTGGSFRGGARVIRRRRPMSAATKARIAAAMAKRWATRRRKKK